MKIPRSALCLACAALAVSGEAAARSPLSVGDLFADTLGFEIFFALLALGFAARSPLGIKARLGLGRSQLPIGSLALLALGTLALSYALDGIHPFFEPPGSGALYRFESELAGLRGAALALAMLSFALVPGIAEELLCRGLVQRGLSARCGPAPAILLAALFFGALHVDPIHALFAALLGLYLGAVAHLARSVRASIGCHIANNAAAVLGAAVAPGLEAPPGASVVVAAAFSFAVLAWYWRRQRPAASAPDAEKERPLELQKRAGSDDA